MANELWDGAELGGQGQYGPKLQTPKEAEEYQAGGNPGGNLNYEQLWDLYEQDKISGYTASEFGMGSQYEQYIQDPTRKPFEILEEGFKANIGGADIGGQSKIASQAQQADVARSQSGMAYSGDLETAAVKADEAIFGNISESKGKLRTALKSDVFKEQTRQLDRFYDDIGAVLSLKAQQEAASAGGGGKK